MAEILVPSLWCLLTPDRDARHQAKILHSSALSRMSPITSRRAHRRLHRRRPCWGSARRRADPRRWHLSDCGARKPTGELWQPGEALAALARGPQTLRGLHPQNCTPKPIVIDPA
jgi:hypothetical protein